MKKIFFLLLPMFVIIALVFTLRNKDISYVEFLDFVQRLRFDNAIKSFNEAITSLNSAKEYFGGIANAKGILEVLRNILSGLSNSFRGVYYLLRSLFDLVQDIGTNLFKITDFLFGPDSKYVDFNPYGY